MASTHKSRCVQDQLCVCILELEQSALFSPISNQVRRDDFGDVSALLAIIQRDKHPINVAKYRAAWRSWRSELRT
eukprot:1382033-Amphidinium_carterae.1